MDSDPSVRRRSRLDRLQKFLPSPLSQVWERDFEIWLLCSQIWEKGLGDEGIFGLLQEVYSWGERL